CKARSKQGFPAVRSSKTSSKSTGRPTSNLERFFLHPQPTPDTSRARRSPEGLQAPLCHTESGKTFRCPENGESAPQEPNPDKCFPSICHHRPKRRNRPVVRQKPFPYPG